MVGPFFFFHSFVFGCCRDSWWGHFFFHYFGDHEDKISPRCKIRKRRDEICSAPVRSVFRPGLPLLRYMTTGKMDGELRVTSDVAPALGLVGGA